MGGGTRYCREERMTAMRVDGVEVKKGCRVTLVSLREPGATVVVLDGAGPKYISGRSVYVDPDDGRERVGSGWKYERARYRVVPGDRRDIVDRAAEANRAFLDARRRHSSAQERAEWRMRDAFRERWLARNPYPAAPTVEALVGGLGLPVYPKYEGE